MHKVGWAALLLWGMLSISCSQKNRCVGGCLNGQSQCTSGGMALCVFQPTTGCHAWVVVPCQAGYTCSDAPPRCVKSGNAGCDNKHHERRCVGQAVYWFDNCGQQGELLVNCGNGTSCVQGQCVRGNGQCSNQCQRGQRACTSTGQVYQCEQDPANQCWQWSAPVPCPAGSTCQGDHCVQGGCQDQCQAGARRCLGNGVQTCVQQNGCLQWAGAIPCSTGQTCQQGACVPGQNLQCPGACTADSQCDIAACGTRRSCRNGSCQAPSSGCSACQSDADCKDAACGNRSVCHNNVCKEPGTFCPPSCSSDADCQPPACVNRPACVQGTCQASAQCPASCQNDAQCGVPACGTKNSCRSGKCAEAFQLTAAEKDLFDALNQARQQNGLPLVKIDEKLTCASRKHANDVGRTRTCGHVGTDGSWPWDRAKACGYPQPKWTVNEIAAGPGFRDGADAVSGWRQSSGHWAAIVHPQAKYVGVAVYNTCFIALFDCCVKGSD